VNERISDIVVREIVAGAVPGASVICPASASSATEQGTLFGGR